MKNVIKKIAAIAMAFTLIGTGTAATKTIAPKFDNSIIASAASVNPNTCMHSTSRRITNVRNVTENISYWYEWSEWVPTKDGKYELKTYGKWISVPTSVTYWDYEDYCPKCDLVFGRGSYRQVNDKYPDQGVV